MPLNRNLDDSSEDRLTLLEIDASFGRAEIRRGLILRSELRQPHLAVIIHFAESVLPLLM